MIGLNRINITVNTQAASGPVSGTKIDEYNTFAELPSNKKVGDYAIVKHSTGIVLTAGRRGKGVYIYNGADWVRVEDIKEYKKTLNDIVTTAATNTQDIAQNRQAFGSYYNKNEIDTTFAKKNEIQVGKSAYDLAVENGYTGTEKEWIETFGQVITKYDYPYIERQNIAGDLKVVNIHTGAVENFTWDNRPQ